MLFRSQRRAEGTRPGATLLLALVLASSETRAGDLYQWVTEDGRVEIGASPPAGVAAKPWNPGQEAAANPSALPAAPASESERETVPASAKPLRASTRHTTEAERRARGRLEEECRTQRGLIEKAAQKIRVLESQIARLDKKLEELEATEVAFQRTSCRSSGAYGPDHSDCVSSSFHRDAEIARTQESLEEAQQKLADLEQRARSAAEDASCSPAAATK